MTVLLPVSQNEIDAGIAANYSNAVSLLMSSKNAFVGAGRRYFQRGTSGYKDNLVPVGGRRPVEAIRKLSAEGRNVSILDVGCANGRAMYDIVTYFGQKGLPIQATAVSGNSREYREHPPGPGRFSFVDGVDLFLFPIASKGTTTHGTIAYREGDMHRMLRGMEGHDVIMSVAAIKYSHDPWRVFADMLRNANDGGYLFVAHLISGTGSRASPAAVYDHRGKEMTPRQLIDALQEANPGYQFACNEDAERRVRDHEGALVHTDENRFYKSKDPAFARYEQDLIRALRDAEASGDRERRRVASVELGRIAGNGFFNVSARRGNEPPYTGLVYAGRNYARGANYVFAPTMDAFARLQRQGYRAV